MLFFFPAPEKKQPFEIESVSALQTFPGKKKQTKKKQLLEKKTVSKSQKWEKGKFWGIDPQVFLKNCLLHSLFTDFMLNFFLSLESVEVKLFQEKKNTLFFFFSEKVEKKKQKFSQMS